MNGVGEIRRAYSLFIRAGQVTEVRVIDCKLKGVYGTSVTAFGYFDNVDSIITELARTQDASGVYFIPNPVKRDLLSRKCNRLDKAKQGESTGDKHITRRTWIAVDLDPQRDSGISSSDEEKAKARERCRAVQEFLDSMGFPEPVVGDSGNGYHLNYRIDLPVDDNGLCSRFLKALDFRFGDDSVAIDQAVKNPSRLWKLYGTKARKGDDTPERPHRRSAIISAPDEWQTVTADLLEKIAAMAPPDPEPEPVHAPRTAGRFDLDAFVEAHNLTARRGWQSYDNGGRKRVLDVCPFSQDHTDDSAFIIERSSGVIQAGCQHNSCSWKWRDLREHFDPGCYDRRNGSAAVAPKCASAKSVGQAEPVGRIVQDVEREEIRWLWRGRIAFGKVNEIQGDPDGGKSTMSIDLAARITRGRSLPLDEPGLSEPAGVVFVATEDAIGDTMRPRLEAAGADLSRCLVIQTVPVVDVDERTGEVKQDERVPVIPEDLPAIQRGVERVNAKLLVIDPLMAHLGENVNAHRDQDVRRALSPLSLFAEESGVAVLIVRHLNKMQGPSAMYRGGGSIGITGVSRSVQLIGKNPQDESQRILAAVKMNVHRPMPSLAFRLVEAEDHPAYAVVEWIGESTLSADDLVRKPDGRYGTEKVDEAEEFLSDLLADGPVMAVTVYERAEESGISERTLNRAKRRLGITSERLEPGRSPWYWLPKKVRVPHTPPSTNAGNLTFKPENREKNPAEKGSGSSSQLDCQHTVVGKVDTLTDELFIDLEPDEGPQEPQEPQEPPF